MKANLLPEMQQVKVSDHHGEPTDLAIEVRRGEKGLYVFLSDTSQLGTSKLAQDAVHYFEKICKSLNLNYANTRFYRHIFQEQMGSIFGQYNIDWEAEEGPCYKFQMLTNFDDMHDVKNILKSTVKLDLAELAGKRAANG